MSLKKKKEESLKICIDLFRKFDIPYFVKNYTSLIQNDNSYRDATNSFEAPDQEKFSLHFKDLASNYSDSLKEHTNEFFAFIDIQLAGLSSIETNEYIDNLLYTFKESKINNSLENGFDLDSVRKIKFPVKISVPLDPALYDPKSLDPLYSDRVIFEEARSWNNIDWFYEISYNEIKKGYEVYHSLLESIIEKLEKKSTKS